jgi:hypothetical protein
MATPVTRLTNTGNLYTIGQFDEVTYDLSSGYQKNLISYSHQFNIAGYWAASGVLQPAPLGVAPDGSNTAVLMTENTDQNTAHWYYKNINPEIPYATYTFSCYFKPVSGDRNFFLQILDAATGGGGGYSSLMSNTNGTLNSYQGFTGDFSNGSGTIVPVGNGWFRAIITQNLGKVANNTIRIALFNNGAQYYNGNGVSCMWIWGAQLEAGSVATDYEPTDANAFVSVPQGFTARTDPNGVATIGSFDEVSINPNSNTSTNLYQYSQNIVSGVNNSYWHLQYVSVTTTTATLAPDNTATAFLMTVIGTQYPVIYPSFINTSSGQYYTVSAYVKYINQQYCCIVNENSIGTGTIGGTATFNLLSGTVSYYGANLTNATITPAGNSWYRITATYLVPAGVTGWEPEEFRIGQYDGTVYNGNQMYIWGPQVEIGRTATNYVPTGANAVPTTPYVQRIDNTGLHRVAGQYDEVTGIVATTNGLAMNIDFAFPQCYPGSGYIVTDMTGNGVNFTYNNQANQFPLYDGTSFYFNGVNFQALCTNTISYPAIETQAFSIEVWINPTILNTQQTGADGNIIVLRENYPVSGFRFGLETPNSLTTDTTAGPVFFCGESGGTLTIRTSTNSSYPISLGKWAQVVVTYDGISTANMYVNGALAISAQGGYRPPTRATGNSSYFFIGGPEEGTKPMNGKIGVVRWYNRPLAASEVADNFNGLRHRYGL